MAKRRYCEKGMTYYLGIHTAVCRKKLTNPRDGHNVIMIEFDTLAKGIHPDNGQLMNSITIHLERSRDWKIGLKFSVIRHYRNNSHNKGAAIHENSNLLALGHKFFVFSEGFWRWGFFEYGMLSDKSYWLFSFLLFLVSWNYFSKLSAWKALKLKENRRFLCPQLKIYPTESYDSTASVVWYSHIIVVNWTSKGRGWVFC